MPESNSPQPHNRGYPHNTDPSEMTQEQFNALCEDRWYTSHKIVWQGWKENVTEVWSDRTFVDPDGGLWAAADPEACERDGKHIPRWHPAEFASHFYCVRCGAQGVTSDG